MGKDIHPGEIESGAQQRRFWAPKPLGNRFPTEWRAQILHGLVVGCPENSRKVWVQWDVIEERVLVATRHLTKEGVTATAGLIAPAVAAENGNICVDHTNHPVDLTNALSDDDNEAIPKNTSLEPNSVIEDEKGDDGTLSPHGLQWQEVGGGDITID